MLARLRAFFNGAENVAEQASSNIVPNRFRCGGPT
jgi:hypothetical protein